ncbi:Cuticle protein AM1274 [Chionoecetes opilio]|uniref:Cuticle protein AM1274 n=1 Tax=Chionoecetes opilio TaxID=41210 RepID=A0A8J5CXM8_CHIOP|nr:Cuticle protein AM1274 [Chionoecetes opilio]
MVGKGLEMPQYIGCQHHILDRILKHVLDTYGSKTTTKPSLNYKIIDELLENYKELQSEYKAETEMDLDENPGWRDDFKFLYELCKAFQHCKKHAAFPVIKWRKLPSLHSARWNSRAIYTLIAYFLLPSWGSVLELPACFIAEKWQETWFCTQKFKETTYDNLLLGITKLGCASALKCLKTHWSRAPSVLDVPRSNMIAKRAVKVCVVVATAAAGISYDKPIPILRNHRTQNAAGEYSFEFETGNGIVHIESGRQYNGQDYTSDEGVPVAIYFTSDKDGYQPQGEVLPVPVELPYTSDPTPSSTNHHHAKPDPQHSIPHAHTAKKQYLLPSSRRRRSLVSVMILTLTPVGRPAGGGRVRGVEMESCVYTMADSFRQVSALQLLRLREICDTVV